MKITEHGRFYTAHGQDGSIAYVIEERRPPHRIVEFMVIAPAAWPELGRDGWRPPPPNLQPRPRRQPPVVVRSIGGISRGLTRN